MVESISFTTCSNCHNVSNQQYPLSGSTFFHLECPAENVTMSSFIEAKLNTFEIRENWRKFLESSRVNDLKQVYQYFSRTEGRTAASYRPTCLDPLWDGNKLCLQPQEKAELLGEHFSQKMRTQKAERPEGIKVLRKEMRQKLSLQMYPFNVNVQMARNEK